VQPVRVVNSSSCRRVRDKGTVALEDVARRQNDGRREELRRKEVRIELRRKKIVKNNNAGIGNQSAGGSLLKSAYLKAGTKLERHGVDEIIGSGVRHSSQGFEEERTISTRLKERNVYSRTLDRSLLI